MKVTKVQQQKQGYKVTTEDKKEHSIPYIKDTFLYKETKAFIDDNGVVEPEFTQEEIQRQELQTKINEAKQYLEKTDHKFYNGYKPKEGEDLVEIERLRDEAREFIRANEGD